MINIDILKQLLSDKELREQASRILSNKVKADVQGLQVGAELSRHLAGLDRNKSGASRDSDEKLIHQLIKEHLDYYETIVNLYTGFNNSLLTRIKDIATTEPPFSAANSATLELEAPVNSTIRAPFRLENNSGAPISVSFESTPFINEDGSQLIHSKTAFDPPSAEIKPGQEMQIDFIAPITEEFSSNQTYYATISVLGIDSMQVIVKLKIAGKKPAAKRKKSVSAKTTAKKASAKKKAVSKKKAKTKVKAKTRKKRVVKKNT